MKQSTWRRIDKSLAATFGSALIGGLLVSAYCLYFFRLNPIGSIGVVFWAFGLGFFAILFHVVIVGLPIQFTLQKLGLNGALSNIGFFAFVVSIIFSVYLQCTIATFLNYENFRLDIFEPFSLMKGLVFGVLLGSIFWLIRRPDWDDRSAVSVASDSQL
ncbi:hypothetical protein [Asticcacaulis sp.]|uniref:hypothetical protein n=1 Tax=Asticcacaulis sp. TaxID=1872648 RepID=UPI003F7C9D60